LREQRRAERAQAYRATANAARRSLRQRSIPLAAPWSIDHAAVALDARRQRIGGDAHAARFQPAALRSDPSAWRANSPLRV